MIWSFTHKKLWFNILKCRFWVFMHYKVETNIILKSLPLDQQCHITPSEQVWATSVVCFDKPVCAHPSPWSDLLVLEPDQSSIFFTCESLLCPCIHDFDVWFLNALSEIGPATLRFIFPSSRHRKRLSRLLCRPLTQQQLCRDHPKQASAVLLPDPDKRGDEN